MNVDLAKLQYFVIAAKTENLQEAARLLRLSPAAISKSIRSLESEFEIKLFIRAGRRIALTDEGLAFAKEAQQIIADVNRKLYRRETETPLERQLRIGSFEVFTTYFLGELIDSEQFNVDIKVFELTPGHLEDALLKHAIDIGITYIPVPRPQIEFLKIATISMGIYASNNCEFLTKDFGEWPFAVPITPVSGAATRVAGLDGWPDDLVARKRTFEVTMMESGLELVRRGKAVMYIPSFIAQLHNRSVKPEFHLKRVSNPPKVAASEQHVYIVKRKSTPEGQEIRKIARCLRRVCKRDAGRVADKAVQSHK